MYLLILKKAMRHLKVPYNFGSIRVQKQGTHLRKNRVNMECPSVAVKHTRPSDGWRHGIQALTLGTPSSHCVDFRESGGARVWWRKRQYVLKHLTLFQGATDTVEQSISMTLGSAGIVNNSIFILPFPSKMQKVQLLKDDANYFGSIHMYNFIVRCKPILKTFKCEKMSAVKL